MNMSSSIVVLGIFSFWPITGLAADASANGEPAFRGLYKELIETNTTLSPGQLHARGRTHGSTPQSCRLRRR